MAMALLAFAGFLRFDELANLKCMALILNFLLKAVKLTNIARALLSPFSSLVRIFAPGVI